ncbi:hypothetical protein HY946_02665 [Candidatus Gottesmanbacteria bacterium]|nr:hypothetical protein [Candidatus Gottesmanbacteria bacterium]
MARFRQFFSFKILVTILLLVIFANLIYLDLFLGSVKLSENQKIITSIPSTVPLATSTPSDNNLCPQSCLAQIFIATSSVKTPVPPTPKTTPASVNPVVSYTSSVKEFFVPFGSGSSSAKDWQDVSGLAANVDSTNYPRVKKITFEASIHIPTGNETAYVRLYNSSDKHPVWFSEMSLEGGTAQFLTSQPVSLDSGGKTYQVQMKTSLGYPAILDQARLHIIIN